MRFVCAVGARDGKFGHTASLKLAVYAAPATIRWGNRDKSRVRLGSEQMMVVVYAKGIMSIQLYLLSSNSLLLLLVARIIIHMTRTWLRRESHWACHVERMLHVVPHSFPTHKSHTL